MLKITRAADPIPVERLNVVLYGQPGCGKTTLGFTADAPLILDFDRGAYRSANRGDAVLVSDWRDVAEINADDLADYSTVVMDTAGRALDVLTAEIIRTNPKASKGGGALSLQGYGELKNRFTAFLKRINSFGKDVVLIAHMDEQKSGDDTIERLDVQGGSKNEIYKVADAMGRLAIRDGARWLLFSPTEASFGKNPAQLPPLRVPSPGSAEFAGFLGGVIHQTKEALNAMTEAQREAAQEQEWFRGMLPTVDDADGINALLARASAGGHVTKALLHERAKALGLAYDAKAKAYAGKSEEAA